MTWNNRVVWSEGMFLRPQHFQQEQRYLEHLVESRCGRAVPWAWGFTELELDESLFGLGKLGISRAQGIFPDGTPFNIPGDDLAPPVFEVPEDARNVLVYLAIPLRRAGSADTDVNDDPRLMSRFVSRETRVSDTNARGEGQADVHVGSLRLGCMMEKEDRAGHACMALARVVERRADGSMVLDEKFVPPTLNAHGDRTLRGYVIEIQGMLDHRAQALGSRVSAPGRGGMSQFAELLMLQVINRFLPVFTHFARCGSLHPETLYRTGMSLCGELATFTTKDRRPPQFADYNHEAPEMPFAQLMDALRMALGAVLEQNAIQLTIHERGFGIRTVNVPEASLMEKGRFVIAAKADLATEALRNQLPRQTKLGPVELISQLVKRHLPGVAIAPLPQTPEEIPYHAGFVYFEIDRQSELWKRVRGNREFAFHISGTVPGLELEVWGIKG